MDDEARPWITGAAIRSDAALRITVFGPGPGASPVMAAHARNLVDGLHAAGHEVVVGADVVRSRDADVVVVVQGAALAVAGQSALVAAMTHIEGAPRLVVILDPAGGRRGRVEQRAMSSLVTRADAVLVDSVGDVARATALGARAARVVTLPRHAFVDGSGAWATYLATIEAVGAQVEHDLEPLPEVRVGVAARVGGRWSSLRARLERRGQPLRLTPADLPEDLTVSEVLHRDEAARGAVVDARRLGLPWARDAVAAWAALGAIAGIVRVLDDRHGAAIVVDESGTGSPFARWARALGLAPVSLDLTHDVLDSADVDPDSLDVIARLHPRGCTATDIDAVLWQASWALRPGGLLAITVPVGDEEPSFALRPADLRAVVARAADSGLKLVGDADGAVLRDLVQARGQARIAGVATYALARLVFRRT